MEPEPRVRLARTSLHAAARYAGSALRPLTTDLRLLTSDL
jgi:hypothetical protein